MSTPPLPEQSPPPIAVGYAQPRPPDIGSDKVAQMAKAAWVAVIIAWLVVLLARRNIESSFVVAMVMVGLQFALIIGGIVFGSVAFSLRHRSADPRRVAGEAIIGIVLGILTILLNIAVVAFHLSMR